jgi:membrane-anchored glycerophosphoryl diester phosphodiesterase (GDPDase)
MGHTNPWVVAILICILLFCFIIYLGIGFIVCLGINDEEDPPDRKLKLKTIFSWPVLMFEFLLHKHKKD